MTDFADSIRKAAEDKERELKTKPLVPEYVAQAADESGVDARVLSYYDPKSNVTENYRVIYTHLKANIKDNDKILAITSATNSEGKSITACNLAVVMARDFKKKVMLIDCNLRKPMLDVYLNLDNAPGLADILNNQKNIQDVIQPTRCDRLFAVTSGTNSINPVELLNQPKLKELLQSIRNSFDYVLLDTPAIIPYSDFKVIAPVIDGVLMSVRANFTRREVVKRATSILDNLDVNTAGFVLTDVQYHIPDFIYRHL